MSTAFYEMRKSIWGTVGRSRTPTGNRPDVDDLTIFLTDGFPFPDVYDPTVEANNMKNKDAIRIIGIAVGDEVNVTTMRRVVSSPYQENLLNVSDFSFIVNQVETLIGRTCGGDKTALRRSPCHCKYYKVTE